MASLYIEWSDELMTLKQFKATRLMIASFAAITWVGCGNIESTGKTFSKSPAEAMPNEEVPLTAFANDYLTKPTESIRDSFCQGGLGDGPQGQIQICCTPSVQKDDVIDQPLDELQECEKSFSVQSAACAIQTKEGVMKGKLWSCKAPEYANYFEEVPSSHRLPESSAIVAAPDPSFFIGRKRRAEARQEAVPEKLQTISSFRPAPVPTFTLKKSDIDPTLWTSPTYYELSSEAEILGRLPKKEYLKFQMEYVGKTYPACNFFLTTALCMAGYCQNQKPLYVAAHYDTYFYKKGWDLIKLPELKEMFKSRKHFDVVIQLDPVRKGRPGHVAIPIGLDERDRVILAQGNLGTVTNEIKAVSDSFITHWKGGFSIFVKRDQRSGQLAHSKSKIH